DRTPEPVDPGNLPRTLLGPFYGAQQRIVESLHAGSPVKGALGRGASPLLEIVDRAPVLVAGVLQRLLITGEDCGRTVIPAASGADRSPVRRRRVLEDLGDFLRAGRSQRRAERAGRARALGQGLRPSSGLCGLVGRRSQGGHATSSRLCVLTEL